MNKRSIKYDGVKIEKAKIGMILIHGRGGSADDILSLKNEIKREDIVFAAPEAENFTWYPYSFLAPRELNQSGITDGFNIINSIITNFIKNGLSLDSIYLLGFSQGACLAVVLQREVKQR